MKFFYWGDSDLSTPFPYLFTVEGDNYPQTKYGPSQGEIAELLSQGYVEISTRTAYNMGWPT